MKRGTHSVNETTAHPHLSKIKFQKNGGAQKNGVCSEDVGGPEVLPTKYENDPPSPPLP